MGQRTPLYDLHLALGAKMVDFGGWDMPLHYGSQVEEHHQVRRDCGVFDVSHMTVIDVGGSQAKAWLQHLLTNDVERLHSSGRALYSAMLNEQGGIVDDMIVYRLDDGYRLVVNASTRNQDLAWMQAHLDGFDVKLGQGIQFRAGPGIQCRHGLRVGRGAAGFQNLPAHRHIIAPANEDFIINLLGFLVGDQFLVGIIVLRDFLAARFHLGFQIIHVRLARAGDVLVRHPQILLDRRMNDR